MCFRPADLAPCGVHVDPEARTLKPEHPQGDDYFGLVIGTNGTAARCRRELHEHVACAEGFVWVRANGGPATGVTCVPTGLEVEPNTWP
jgi:hypothetical protein